MLVFSICFDKMFRIAFIVAFAFATSVAGVDVQQCRSIVNPELLKCCSTMPPEKGMTASAQCGEPSKDPSSCTREICIGTKLGYGDSDGKIDKEKLEKIMTEDFSSQPDLLNAIKTKCINGDLARFGAPDHCDLLKMRNCFLLQYISKCPQWNDEGKCKGVKALVAECSPA